ncbi:TonB-dependent receptor [Pseudomonas aeruginosa]|uniref:TonB-dependent receptor n=1 Tax=Pseudomonas aeruginosa TaxID=287 RepID=UPI00093E9FA9|nr:TonB-dependent receptor [Pseudomonas aeruginosa]MBX5525808.1 TonB-dependent receptor [Pseudomonas aeruginosa]MDI4129650.1 TonB-dependent receptor [Pseudomonas aeruginosa]HBN9654117.1 TonB-dependent receptor [Pseudomonas aeruginosa]
MPHHAPSTRLPSSLALAALLAAAYAAPPEARAETPAPAAKALTFDVAAGPLDQVLLGISRQSGLLISFEQSLVRGRQAPAVRGPLSVDQALEQALRGSGLQFRRSERGAVISAAPLRAAVPAAKVQPLAAKAEQTLERVVVTGSRIPRAQQEGPSPVTVISSEEIQNRGYRNVFEALQTQTQNTGMTQGEDYGNTWQPAANALNLRDLGPNHTLVLINGRRVADYPTAYGGSVNFTNLANIPAVMIDRIEILSGGASAIYGSDAIAGVVNIVLKKKFDGVDVNLRAGTTERGGGDNQRLQLVGGGATGDFEGLFGLQVEQRQPVWANQRGFMDSYPDGNNVGYRLNPQSGRYLGDASCAGLGGLFGGNVAPVPGARGGYRCMTDQYYNNYWTLQTKKENYDGYAGGTWHLSDSGKLFADLLFGFDHLQNNTRGPSFTSPDFINASSGDLERWYRLFSPEEIGGKSSNNSKWREVSWTGTLGYSDRVANTSWEYELAATRSEYRSDRTTRYTPAAGILDLYLGRKLGERDGYPVYDPDPARLGRPLSEEEWRSLRRNVTQHSESYSQTYSFTGNGELFDLPAGPVAFAGVLEVGKQGYRIRPDSQYNDGSLYNVSKASSSGGSRDRYAAGGEFSIPLHDTLLASAAGRWDQYRFSGRTEEQTTYNLGLEWHPLTSLLLRGSYGTSFRAPDLNYIYQADANGYYPAQKDYYGCEKGVDGACKNGRVDYVQSGTPDLKSERGRYWSYGFVWSPSSRFDFSADYYHIQIDDLLTTLDPDKLLRDEAACRSGGLDPDSAQCRDTLARVERNAGDASVDPNRLNKVYVNAINAAKERTSGIDLRSNIRWGAGDYGAFSSTLGYTLVLSHDYKQSDDYPSENQRDSLDSHDWRSKLNASLTWDYAQFTSTLFAVRYGSVTNAAGSGRLSPWTVFNASARYRLNERASVGLTVNNLLDQIKEDDSDGWPYYPTGNYDAMGRQWWLDFSYHFGG